MEPDDRRLLRAVGRRIAELRAERGWTQEAFAEHYGASAKYAQALELGSENLSLTTLARIARTLKVPVRELLAPPRSLRANPGRPRITAAVRRK
jgi:transcriptional regulator with XRE-family HTH domain